MSVIAKNNKDAASIERTVPVGLNPTSHENFQTLSDATIGQLDNGELTFDEALPQLLQYSQNFAPEDADYSAALVDTVLTHFDPSQVSPSNIQQVTEMIKNVQDLRQARALPMPESVPTLEKINQALRVSLQNSSIYQEKLDLNAQITRDIYQKTMDNIAMIVSTQDHIDLPITKQIVDHLGLSLLLFNIPGDSDQNYISPAFTIQAQRLDSLDFQNRAVNHVVSFPPSGIGYFPDSVYESYDTVPDSHRDLVYITWNNGDETYANQMSLTLFDSQTQQEVPVENLQEDILFTHLYEGRLREDEVTCVSR